MGGKIKEIHRHDKKIYVLIQNGLDEEWRSLEYNEKTHCLGVGETIWWQLHQGYWSCGKSHDIKIGKCYPACNPKRLKVLKANPQQNKRTED